MRLPAEWEPQAFVQIAWPHKQTDWHPYLPAAVRCYQDIAREVSQREDLVVVTPDPQQTLRLLSDTEGINMERVHVVEAETNDTWARDHAFISCTGSENEETTLKELMDFCFNGWGLKFAADLDNQINSKTFDELQKLFEGKTVKYVNAQRMVLEGGSIESDGCGTLLTTTSCLLAPNRNYYTHKLEAEADLKRLLHANRVLWLDHGYLAGDDTDGHIDTLARLCPNDTIAYVQCLDSADEHYEALHSMEQELKVLRTIEGKPYRLIPLPMPHSIYEGDFDDAVEEEAAQRLPATYANFLIVNGAVLIPTYGQPQTDEQAKGQLQKAFPDREIVGIDCRVLIRQHGSLHCVTMQYPK